MGFYLPIYFLQFAFLRLLIFKLKISLLFISVYREKGTDKTAIVQKLATALERADVRTSRATMSASADEQSIYSVLVNKEFRRVFDPRSPVWITDNQSGPCPSGSGLGDIDVLLIDNVSTVPAHSTSIG